MVSDIKRKQFTQTEDWKISDRYNSLMERVNSANRDVDEKTIDIKTDLNRNLVGKCGLNRLLGISAKMINLWVPLKQGLPSLVEQLFEEQSTS